MKKTYIIPETEIVDIAPSSLIAESLGGGDDASRQYDPDTDGDVKYRGRGLNIWGDDDWDD